MIYRLVHEIRISSVFFGSRNFAQYSNILGLFQKPKFRTVFEYPRSFSEAEVSHSIRIFSVFFGSRSFAQYSNILGLFQKPKFRTVFEYPRSFSEAKVSHNIRISSVLFRSQSFAEYFSYHVSGEIPNYSALALIEAAPCQHLLTSSCHTWPSFGLWPPLRRCMSGVETGSTCGHLPCRSDTSFCPSLNFPEDALENT